MLFRDAADGPAAAPWIVTGSMGGDAQPQIHAQVVSALVDGAADLQTAIGAPRWFVAPRELLTPPVDVQAEPRFVAGVLEALEALGHPVSRTSPFDRALGHAHAIELLDGGPAAGGSLDAVTDPRSEGLPAAW
jgi:gamma-glutamyltranspeptidase/glutathione hydrolase